MAGLREAVEMKGEMGMVGQVEGGWEVHDSMAPTPESASAAERHSLDLFTERMLDPGKWDPEARDVNPAFVIAVVAPTGW